jgi:putative membrane protein
MAQHIVLMNVLAPCLALAMRRLAISGWARWLLPATLIQLGLLWFWHAPFLLPQVMHAPGLQPLMQGTLLAAAMLFWAAVVDAAGTRSWRPLAALLLTSKLFCLLGVLLTFAPRALYAHHDTAAALADQQLAGLLMLVACPATYLLGAVIVAARWLRVLEGEALSFRVHN